MPDSLSAARRIFALAARPLRLGKHFALGNCMPLADRRLDTVAREKPAKFMKIG
jgi:hypothetical protein